MTNACDRMPFHPEDRLILSTLRMDASREIAMREALQQPIDWPFLQRQAIVHSVLPLVYMRLAKTVPDLVPPDALDQLRALYEINIRRVLLLTADLLKVIRLLEAQGIPVIPLKGLALAELAYGDPALRHFVDLDILISPRNLARAQSLLIDAGIVFDAHETAPLPADQLEKKIRRHQNYRISQRSVRIELHWQLGGHCYPNALPVDAVLLRSEVRNIAGHPMRVLCLEDLVLHLCYHGAQHYWCKFSYLSDFSNIVTQLEPSQWNNVIARSKEQGVYRIFLTGLYLAQRLLALPIPDEMTRMVEADRACVSLARLVHTVLTRHAGIFPNMLEQGKFRFMISDTLWPTIRWLTGEIVPGIITPTDTDHRWVRLPKPLWGAYWLLRPIRQSIKLSCYLATRKSARRTTRPPAPGPDERVSGGRA